MNRTNSCCRMFFCQTTVVVTLAVILLYPELVAHGFSTSPLFISPTSPLSSTLKSSTDKNNNNIKDDSYQSNDGAVRTTTNKVRVMTYNIHAWRDSDHKCNFERVVDVINQVQPDIVCLNEVLHPFATPTSSADNNDDNNEIEKGQEQSYQEYYDLVQSGKAKGVQIDPEFLVPEKESFLQLLSDRINLSHYDYFGATDDSYFGLGASFGNAILSRYSIQQNHHVLLETQEGDINLGSQERAFVDPRAFSMATIDVSSDKNDDSVVEEQLLGICYTHLDHKSEELREKQMQRGLTEIMASMNDTTKKSKLTNMPWVICGDLNTFQKSDCSSDGWKAIVNMYEENNWSSPPETSLVLKALENGGFRDAFYDVYDDHKVHPDPTCWTHKPLMRIDHMWISDDPPPNHEKPAMTVTQYERFESKASDHFPIWIDLEIG